MSENGTQKYLRDFERSETSETMPGKQAIQRYITPLTEAITERRTRKVKGGRTLGVFKLASNVEDETLAFCAMRAIVNGVCKEELTMSALIMSIGGFVEDAINLVELTRKEKKYLKLNIEKRGYNSVEQKRYALEYKTRLTTNQKGNIGKHLISMFTTTFPGVIIREMEWEYGTKSTSMIVPSKELHDWILENRDFCANATVNHLPMLCEPLPWVDPLPMEAIWDEDMNSLYAGAGGYLTETLQNYNLIKKTSDDRVMEEHSTKQEDGTVKWNDYSKEYDALNAMQAVPYRINQRIKSVVSDILANKTNVKGMASTQYDNRKLLDYPFDVDYKEKGTMPKDLIPKFRIWLETNEGIREKKKAARSKSQANALTLGVANREEFQDVDLYFVWNIDYRCRKYPLGSFLQPQGTDVAKSLLDFSNGSLIDSDSKVRWLHIIGSGLWANEISDTDTRKADKVNLDDRVKWAEDNMSKIIEAGDNPLENDWWMMADSPFQFLRYCMVMGDYAKYGKETMCTMPLNLDASCSGLQVYSSLLRDPIGAKATNLTFTEEPQDIYTDVADKMIDLLGNDNYLDCAQKATEGAHLKKGLNPESCPDVSGASAWILDNIEINRKMTKRSTMAKPYSIKKNSLASYIDKDYLQVKYDLDTDAALDMDNCEHFSTYSDIGQFLKEPLWASINLVVSSADVAMNYLQSWTKVSNAFRSSFHFYTPSGFKVTMGIRKTASSEIEDILFNGDKVKARVRRETDEIDVNRQRSAFPANYIHCIDSSIVTLAVNKAVDEGITNFFMIHDSFGTSLDSIERFSEIVREVMVEIFSRDLLDELHKEMLVQFPSDVPVPTTVKIPHPMVPEYGNFDVTEILNSPYSFL